MPAWVLAFHFLRPWLLLLLILPILLLGRYLRRGSQSSWERVIDRRLLPYLLIRGSSGQRQIIGWLALLGLCAGIVAAAGPSWIKEEIPALEAENPLMIALNLSTDMEQTDITPSRLERAKFALKDLLKAIGDTQIGLLVYTSEPFVVLPFANDPELAENLLPILNPDIMPANGDRADRAIALAAQKMRAASYQRGRILLVTSDIGQSFDLALQQAATAKTASYTLDILSATAVPTEKLKLLADAGGGKVLTSADDAAVSAYAAQIAKTSDRLTKGKNQQSVWLDYGYYLLIVPLLCCLYFFRRGILTVALFLAASQAQAGFLLNANQEGLRAFNAGNYADAAEHFSDSSWKAASLYRQGDYDAAFRFFNQKQDIESLYNQGNALAKGGKIDQAIKAYEQVLAQNPDHEDAEFNLEYLKRMQQQQPPQPQQQQSQSAADPKQQNSENQPSDGQSQQQNQDGEQKQESSANDQNDQNSGGSNLQQTTQQGQSQQGESEQTPQPQGEHQAEEKPKQPQQGGGTALQEGNPEDKYNEETQARARRYREIPEDPGGLLRAFILQEYQQNRYQDR